MWFWHLHWNCIKPSDYRFGGHVTTVFICRSKCLLKHVVALWWLIHYRQRLQTTKMLLTTDVWKKVLTVALCGLILGIAVQYLWGIDGWTELPFFWTKSFFIAVLILPQFTPLQTVTPMYGLHLNTLSPYHWSPLNSKLQLQEQCWQLMLLPNVLSLICLQWLMVCWSNSVSSFIISLEGYYIIIWSGGWVREGTFATDEEKWLSCA